MHVLLLQPGRPVELAGARDDHPVGGYHWLDLDRSDPDWQSKAGCWLDRELHERHLLDSLNDRHPPYYDGTDDYDMLIMRSLDPASPSGSLVTRPITLFLFEHALVSVRPAGDDVFTRLHQRLLSGQRRSPPDPAGLLYLLLDEVVDRLLAQRGQVGELIGSWQERLLDPRNGFQDWSSLMRLRSHLRRLEITTEAQIDALAQWREQTSHALDENLRVRFNDLQEHLGRVLRHATVMQADIDALVQIYFSATSQRTNSILQLLTIVSVIFLPLNLIVGLFGMNFKFMPLLHQRYGFWVTLGGMLAVVLAMLYWTRRKRWV